MQSTPCPLWRACGHRAAILLPVSTLPEPNGDNWAETSRLSAQALRWQQCAPQSVFRIQMIITQKQSFDLAEPVWFCSAFAKATLLMSGTGRLLS